MHEDTKPIRCIPDGQELVPAQYMYMLNRFIKFFSARGATKLHISFAKSPLAERYIMPGQVSLAFNAGCTEVECIEEWESKKFWGQYAGLAYAPRTSWFTTLSSMKQGEFCHVDYTLQPHHMVFNSYSEEAFDTGADFTSISLFLDSNSEEALNNAIECLLIHKPHSLEISIGEGPEYRDLTVTKVAPHVETWSQDAPTTYQRDFPVLTSDGLLLDMFYAKELFPARYKDMYIVPHISKSFDELVSTCENEDFSEVLEEEIRFISKTEVEDFFISLGAHGDQGVIEGLLCLAQFDAVPDSFLVPVLSILCGLDVGADAGQVIETGHGEQLDSRSWLKVLSHRDRLVILPLATSDEQMKSYAHQHNDNYLHFFRPLVEVSSSHPVFTVPTQGRRPQYLADFLGS